MFGSRRHRKWNEWSESRGPAINGYLFCPSCRHEWFDLSVRMETVKSCEKCNTKGVVLLRRHDICHECNYAFPEIDYKLDRNSGASCVCPKCGHAEFGFRNKSVYLPDSRKPLKPERWRESAKNYPISQNKKHLRKQSRGRDS